MFYQEPKKQVHIRIPMGLVCTSQAPKVYCGASASYNDSTANAADSEVCQACTAAKRRAEEQRLCVA